MEHFLVFDVESSKLVPDGRELDDFRPLGISVASTCTPDFLVRSWHDNVQPDSDMYGPQLTRPQARDLADYLLHISNSQHRMIITWNGLGFDFRTLAEECGDSYHAEALAQLALSEYHIDVAFHMFKALGYMCRLQGACLGMGLPGKSEGVTGKLVPEMWAQSRAQQELCLEYSTNDVCITSLLFQAIIHNRKLRWLTQTGRANAWDIPGDGVPISVKAALALPQPNYLKWNERKFAGWALEAIK